MKKIIAVLVFVIASATSAIACECYFEMTQELTCSGGSSVSSYIYCGSGSYCSKEALQAAYLAAAMQMMEHASMCK